MTNGTTMNAALFEALRDAGIDEGHAARVAKAVPPAETIATKVELQTEIKDVRAIIPDAETLADKAVTDEKFDRVLAEIQALREDTKDIREEIKDLREEMRAEFKAVREEIKATDSKIDRMDERAIGDRKIFFIILGILIAVGAGVFQILLGN